MDVILEVLYPKFSPAASEEDTKRPQPSRLGAPEASDLPGKGGLYPKRAPGASEEGTKCPRPAGRGRIFGGRESFFVRFSPLPGEKNLAILPQDLYNSSGIFSDERMLLIFTDLLEDILLWQA